MPPCISDTGFIILEMLPGVRLCKALYVNTDLLYCTSIRWLMESHPSSLNISTDRVVYSACSILRAARFCSLDNRSVLLNKVLLKVTDP